MGDNADVQLDAARATAAQAFRDLQDGLAVVLELFGHQQIVADNLIELLEGTEPLSAIVARFGVARERTALVAALDLYETRRRESRLAMWRLLMAEGNTIGEISRMFGLSRQLVSRQLKENSAHVAATLAVATVATP